MLGPPRWGWEQLSLVPKLHLGTPFVTREIPFRADSRRVISRWDRQWNCLSKCVPKWSLGTREKREATFRLAAFSCALHAEAMSHPRQDQGKVPHVATDQFWVGVSMGILFLFSAANIFVLLFMVPKFEQIFADTLPGKPLPTVTEFILTARVGLGLINMFWLIFGSVLVRQQKRYAILWINVGTIWNIFQIVSTTIALFMPMISTNVGMGEGA
jgi:hypothetical protein